MLAAIGFAIKRSRISALMGALETIRVGCCNAMTFQSVASERYYYLRPARFSSTFASFVRRRRINMVIQSIPEHFSERLSKLE